jgi:acetyl-CoA acyltransferase
MGAARGGADSPLGPSVEQRYGTKQFNQGTGADLIAKRWNLSRERLDELSLESHARAARATDQGAFASQIAPLAGLDADQGIRRGDTMETMASLKPAFGPDGLHTAGSSSQISDGAAALLITTSERAAERGWRPIARFHTSLVVGVDPVTMLTGPIPATERLLDRAGLDIGDIGVFEINEAFAAVLGAWLDETGAEHKRVNPLGGAIALGHPLGGSGARLMTTLVHHMRDNNIRYGLQAMCEGGGMANATLLELL